MRDAASMRADWTALCRFLEKRGPTRIDTIPDRLRYLVRDPGAMLMFTLAAKPSPPCEYQDKRPPITGRVRGKIRLVKRWRFRLVVGGCEVPYPFARVADADGTPWRSL